jgi:MFS transporter, ACS family, hexuronate transporter
MLGPSRYRWIICFLLFLITVCSYVNRQLFSLVAPAVAGRYHFTNSDIAIIINAFLIAYTFGQLFSGGILDWIGSRKGFTLAALVWSLTTILTCLARGVWSFSFFRFLLGLAESANFPGGVKVVAECFPTTERTTAVGIFSSGASIGAIVTPPLVVYLILHFGWELAFVIAGIPGLLWAFAWYRIYSPLKTRPEVNRVVRSPALADRDDLPTSEIKSTVPWKFFLRQRGVWGIFLGRFIEEPASWFYFNWLAIYLKGFRDVSLSHIGLLLIIPFVTLDIGYVGGGWAASQLIKSGWSLDRTRKTVMVLSALCMISSIPAVYAQSSLNFTLLVSIATFGHCSWGANIFTLPGDIVPNRWVASVYGITAFGGGIGSIIFMQITGKLVDIQRSFNTVFVIAGILPVLAALVFVTVVGRIRPIDLPVSPGER